RWQRGRLRSQELPDIAREILAAGLDAPALYELVGLVNPTTEEAAPLFRLALEQLGRFSGTIEDQPLHIAAELAQRILDREIGLLAGCREMVAVCNRGKLRDSNFDVFIAVESETDMLPLGAVRERWSAEALVEVDQQIRRVEESARDEIDRACRA